MKDIQAIGIRTSYNSTGVCFCKEFIDILCKFSDHPCSFTHKSWIKHCTKNCIKT